MYDIFVNTKIPLLFLKYCVKNKCCMYNIYDIIHRISYNVFNNNISKPTEKKLNVCVTHRDNMDIDT